MFVGFPFEWKGNLYNAAAVVNRGELLGIVPKTEAVGADGSCEERYFTFSIAAIARR